MKAVNHILLTFLELSLGMVFIIGVTKGAISKFFR